MDFSEIIPLSLENATHSYLEEGPYIFDQNEILNGIQIELDTFEKVILTIIAIIKDVIFNIQIRFHRFFYERPAYIDAHDLQTENSNQNLCVMLHGLKATSFGFDALHDAILDDSSLSNSLRVYRPIIEEKGNCSLSEASLPIAEKIEQWALSNPLKPIFLIGTSNGGRVAANIAAMFSENSSICNNPLHTFCIATPFYGTQMLGSKHPQDGDLNQFVWQKLVDSPLASLVFKEVVFEELSYGATPAKQLINRVQQAARRGVNFTFYATMVDPLVTPFPVSIPKNIEGARAFLLEAEGHSSIVHAIQDHLIDEMRESYEGMGQASATPKST